MTAGSIPKGGGRYVVYREPGPVFVTSPAQQNTIGLTTPDIKNARTWRDRAAVWRWLKLRQGGNPALPQFGADWHYKRVG
jgi:hypothetical protein